MAIQRITRKQIKSLRRQRLVMALAGAMVMPVVTPVSAAELPQFGTVVNGTASINSTGNQMIITQTTKGAIINWGEFNIGAGYGVTFDQQFGASSVTLNRVIGFGYGYGANMSMIDGSLSANGSVFIINPAGVTFGAGSQVNVGGLVASTMDITDANFNNGVANGHYQFDPMTAVGSQTIAVDSGGNITTTAAGTVALLGRQVINNGSIAAPGGSVLFGSAESVTLDFQGDGLTMLTITGPGIASTGGGPCPSFPCPVAAQPELFNYGTITADGGQILMRTAATASGAGGGIANIGTLQARSLVSRNGRVELTSDQGVVWLGYNSASAGAGIGTIDVSGQSGASGGTVLVRAGDFQMFNDDITPSNPTDPSSVGSVINASGDLGGGVVDIQATNLAQIYSLSSILANGGNGHGGQISVSAGTLAMGAGARMSANGNAGVGGDIRLESSGEMNLYGTLSATGTTAGGNIVTQVGAYDFDFRGLRVSAGAPTSSGSWLISVPTLTVVNGNASGELDAVSGGSWLQDAELNHALSNNTSVTLQSDSSVYFNAAQVVASSNAQVALTVNSEGEIGGGNSIFSSSSGPLNLYFNSDASGNNTGYAGIDFSNTTFNSNGGDVWMYGQSDALNGAAIGYSSGIRLDGVDIQTTGGNLLLRGGSTGSDISAGSAGVSILGSAISTGTGALSVFGNGAAPIGGIHIEASRLSSLSGSVVLQGVGGESGLSIYDTAISTDSGQLMLRGRGFYGTSSGLILTQGTSLQSNSGEINLSGEGGSGAGVEIDSVVSGAAVGSNTGLVVIRAGNDGSSDALRIGGGIRSGLGVNLRPGGVDLNGVAYERLGDGIVLGTGNGFSISDGELDFVTSPTLVIGSRQHQGEIDVRQSIARDGNLTLQNAMGGINLNASVDVGSGVLALLTDGSIAQGANGGIRAHSLLAVAGGDVLLDAAENDVASNTLAGRSGGSFRFLDSNALAIGNVSALGFDGVLGAFVGANASGVSAVGDAWVRNLTGDLTLNAEVSANSITLVTAGVLQNAAGVNLNTVGGNWHVWASTWVGENRGGLSGSGDLPNLYGCVYLGVCGVTVSSGDNHFIYAQQPTAVITFDDFSREYGLDNPSLTFHVAGMILGDSQSMVADGNATTLATIGSDVGNYLITGSFVSRAGYLLQIVPGNLSITPAPLMFTADPFVRYIGYPNDGLSGTVTGFRNGDTLDSVFGGSIWSTDAGMLSPVGFYAITGAGVKGSSNYAITQAPGNATALRVIPMPQMPFTPVDFVREPVETYVYDRNFGPAPMCAVTIAEESISSSTSGDMLANEWSKVRSRPNLTNCFDSERRSACGDF